jgi:hypothetical protein
MKLSRAFALLMALLPASAGICAMDTSVLMQYAFEPGVEVQSHLSASLLGLEMGGGIPVALTASAEVDVTTMILEVDAEGTATVQLSFGTLKSELMGETEEKDDLEPITFKIDKYGRTVAAEGSSRARFDLLTAGGLPVHLMAALTTTVQLSEQGVAPGETWTVQGGSQLPGLGEATLEVNSHLDSLDAERAVITTVMQGNLPDFTTDNPIQEGEIEIKQAQVTIDPMIRTLSLASGLVETADAKLTITCTANMGGVAEFPLTLTSIFELKPLGGEQEARGVSGALTVASTPRLRQPAPPTEQRGPTAAYQRVMQSITAYLGTLLGNVLGGRQGL